MSGKWKPGEPTAKLLRDSAAARGEDWTRLVAAMSSLGAAWAELRNALEEREPRA